MKAYGTIAIVLFFLQVACAQSILCPANAKRFGNTCYRLQQRPASWISANNECKLLGGQLATINGRSLNNFFYRNYRIGSKSNIWFGLKRCGTRWCRPGDKRSVYLKWNRNEPNNVGGNEHCVEMWGNGYWNDAPCRNARPFICEIPVDTDECALGTASCHTQAICNNIIGSFICVCKRGFTGSGTTCNDIDECSSGSNGCDGLATCKNTYGSYNCICPVGYTGSGKICNKKIIGHDDIYEELQEHDVATDKRLTSIEHLLQKTGQGKILNELEEHDKIADKKLSNIEHLLQKLLGITPAQSKVATTYVTTTAPSPTQSPTQSPTLPEDKDDD